VTIFNLEKFTKNDVSHLLSEVTGEEFMIQWGGFSLNWPLSEEQIGDMLISAESIEPPIKLFKFTETSSHTTAGHIELLRIDYTEKIAWLGRVLVFAKYRGKGAGLVLVELTLDHLFNEMNFETAKLNVYDFNLSAISCYEKAGFSKEKYFENAHSLNGRNYSHYCMALTRDDYTARKNQ